MPKTTQANNAANDAKKRVIVNMDFFKDITMGDYEFEKDLLMIFKDSSEKNMKKMEEAIRDNDNQAWCMACHAFKGGANSIGAVDLAVLLEHGQKNPKETNEQKTELLKKAKAEFDIVVKFLGGEIERSLMF
jgi:HPt (histidine-containing phosphotransfer) domain-containing protein